MPSCFTACCSFHGFLSWILDPLFKPCFSLVSPVFQFCPAVALFPSLVLHVEYFAFIVCLKANKVSDWVHLHPQTRTHSSILLDSLPREAWWTRFGEFLFFQMIILHLDSILFCRMQILNPFDGFNPIRELWSVSDFSSTCLLYLMPAQPRSFQVCFYSNKQIWQS